MKDELSLESIKDQLQQLECLQLSFDPIDNKIRSEEAEFSKIGIFQSDLPKSESESNKKLLNNIQICPAYFFFQESPQQNSKKIPNCKKYMTPDK
jgi:hypothetical protein